MKHQIQIKIQIINANTRESLKALATNSIDLIILNLPEEHDENLNYTICPRITKTICMLRTNGLMTSLSCPLLTGKIPPIPLIVLKQFLFCIVIGTNPITRKRKHILIGFVLHPVGREQHSSEVSTKLMLMAGGTL